MRQLETSHTKIQRSELPDRARKVPPVVAIRRLQQQNQKSRRA